MNQKEKNARRLLRQTMGLSPGFRYYDNPYEGQTEPCPFCGKTIAAGLESCPECSQSLPGRARDRTKLRKAPGVVLLILALGAVLGLGLYFFVQTMIESGFWALLLSS